MQKRCTSGESDGVTILYAALAAAILMLSSAVAARVNAVEADGGAMVLAQDERDARGSHSRASEARPGNLSLPARWDLPR